MNSSDGPRPTSSATPQPIDSIELRLEKSTS
jgi:hypothetical protein